MPQPSVRLTDQLAQRIFLPDFEYAVHEQHPEPYQALIAAVVKEHNLEPDGADLEGLCDPCRKLWLAYDSDCTLESRAEALAAYQLGLAIGRRVGGGR